MRFFLRTKKFKIAVCIIAAVLIVSIVIYAVSGMLSPVSGFFGTLAAPFEQLAADAGNAIRDYQKKMSDSGELLLENRQLSDELSELRQKTVDYEELKRENEFYKQYLEIKDRNPDFTFLDAKSIAADSDDPFCGFTLNKGSLDGVKAYDPVVTGNYVVGFISEVGLTTSKVTTILSPQTVAGANDSRTDDKGLITGTADYAAEHQLKLYNLSRSCNVAVGDFLITSGQGLFPEGLLIGTVENIKSDNYSSSLYAVVTPFADFSDIRACMIITGFSGQGVVTLPEGN